MATKQNQMRKILVKYQRRFCEEIEKGNLYNENIA